MALTAERRPSLTLDEWSLKWTINNDDFHSLTLPQAEERRRELTTEGYQLFFDQIGGLKNVETNIPHDSEDLNKKPKLKTVPFEGHDLRLGSQRSGWPFSAGSKWRVGIGGYKVDAQSSNPDYYKDNTDEKAVIFIHPEGRDFDRILVNIQLSQARKLNEPFNLGIHGYMQVEERTVVYARDHDRGWLQAEESRFAKMTELDLLRLVNSLAQIYRGTPAHQ